MPATVQTVINHTAVQPMLLSTTVQSKFPHTQYQGFGQDKLQPRLRQTQRHSINIKTSRVPVS